MLLIARLNQAIALVIFWLIGIVGTAFGFLLLTQAGKGRSLTALELMHGVLIFVARANARHAPNGRGASRISRAVGAPGTYHALLPRGLHAHAALRHRRRRGARWRRRANPAGRPPRARAPV